MTFRDEWRLHFHQKELKRILLLQLAGLLFRPSRRVVLVLLEGGLSLGALLIFWLQSSRAVILGLLFFLQRVILLMIRHSRLPGLSKLTLFHLCFSGLVCD